MDGKVLLLNIHRFNYDLMQITNESPGILYLAGYLESRGYDALVFQGEPSAALDFIENEVKKSKILAAGFYCDYENTIEVFEMSALISEKYKTPVILGGPQVSGFDARYILGSGCLAAVYGEGELTLFGLLECLYNGAGDWKKLPGIIFAGDSGALVKNEPGPVIENLDELPLPAFHRWVNKPECNSVYIQTGRGCPFSCEFCYEGSLKRKVRLRSVSRVIEHIESALASEPGLNYIAFADDTLIMSRERVSELCAGLSELRKKRNFVWFCEGHMRQLIKYPGLMAEMTRAGMIKMQVGIESGSQKVLDAYGKKITTAEIETVVKAAAAEGVHQMIGFFITGGPFESREIIEENKKFAEKLLNMAPGVIILGVSPLMAYPSTGISRCPEKFGIEILDPAGLTVFSDFPVTKTAALSREEIAAGQNELIQHILDTMMKIFKEGRVPHEAIINCFRDFNYGAQSVWYLSIYNVLPFLKGYYTLMSRNAVKRSQDIAPDEIMGWRPQRIMEMWHDVDFSQGYPAVGKDVLSPLEFELLLYSTGKMTLKQLIEKAQEKFGRMFDCEADFQAEAMNILKTFEKKYWLAYAPF
ncbi:MAG TPA: radical SAM protein [Candidatus Wallbacteria bacterium]|nr:radical SAM protein [Candidatus Wallbacteria bacterium]